jgi:hypothetical protein
MQNEDRERVCRVRRAILKAFKDYNPACADIDEIKNHHDVGILQASNAELVEQWNDLTKYGYIANIPDLNGMVKVITPKGLSQIKQETERHFQIWGKIGTKDGIKD